MPKVFGVCCCLMCDVISNNSRLRASVILYSIQAPFSLFLSSFFSAIRSWLHVRLPNFLLYAFRLYRNRSKHPTSTYYYYTLLKSIYILRRKLCHRIASNGCEYYVMWPETHLSRNLKIILSFSLIIINVAQIFSWFTET